jgi:hypothetical protein
MHGKVAGQAALGLRPVQIARSLKLDYSTIQYTIQQDFLHNEGKSLPQKPRRKSYTLAKERKLL